MVTVYTVVGTNLLTADIGRGHRGIEIDTKETMAMRNIVHFNCVNPFRYAKSDEPAIRQSFNNNKNEERKWSANKT